MFLKNRYVLIIAASAFGLLPLGLAHSFQVGFGAPGVGGKLENRTISVKGCGQSSSTSTSSGGALFPCNFYANKKVKYEFTLSYVKTDTQKKVIPNGTFTVRGGPIKERAECKGVTSVTLFNNKLGVCSPGYGVYATVTPTTSAPWGQSQWAPHDTGFVLQIGGAPAE